MHIAQYRRPGVAAVATALLLSACSGGAQHDGGDANNAIPPRQAESSPDQPAQPVTALALPENAATPPPAASENGPEPAKAGRPEPKSMPSSTPAGSVAETTGSGPPPLFAQCVMCHTIKQGAPSTIGPNLFGVMGRPAGSLPGYQYSSALKNLGNVWDKPNLSAFLESPMTVAPGTKMAFGGVKDPDQRELLIRYLATLK